MPVNAESQAKTYWKSTALLTPAEQVSSNVDLASTYFTHQY